MLDSFYHFKKLPDITSKTRFDLIEYSNEYEPLHNPLKRTGDIVIYLCENHCVKDSARKTDKAITQAGSNISSVYIPNISKAQFAFGDCRGTQDAILMNIQENDIQLYISKGKKNNVQALFNLFIDNELESEIQRLKKEAVKIKNA